MCAKHGQKTFRFSKQKMSVKDIQAYFFQMDAVVYYSVYPMHALQILANVHKIFCDLYFYYIFVF